jgi:hypothetical protein
MRMCDEERPKEEEESRIKAEKEESERFFHKPSANADFDFWSKAAYWTLDEAVALSFGKDPKKVYWDGIKSLVERSSFIQGYGKVRELANRAKAAGLLKEPTLPLAFVLWAKKNDLAFPEQLEKNVTAQAQKGAVPAAHAVASPKLPTPAKDKKDELKTREKDTLLKLVIGMAVEGYRYDPKAAKNTAVADIVSDLNKLGLSLDADTVRRWLKEAAETQFEKPNKT